MTDVARCGKCGKPIQICSAALYIKLASQKLEALDLKLTIHYLKLANRMMEIHVKELKK